MTKNPLYNAGTASLYIIGVAGIIYTLTKTASDQPDNNFLIPIFMLSLLVLSVTVMGYVFFYTPLTLLLKGEHKAAIDLFLKTLGFFAGFTVSAFVVMLLAL
jgi:hypothetical protein